MKIEIYGRSTNPADPTYCKWCAAAKDLLDQRKIPYDFTNINENGFDIDNLTTVIAPGAKTVPVIVVNGKWIGGFDQLNSNIKVLSTRYSIEELAKNNSVQVKFHKQNGDLRVMNATLNPLIIENILGDSAPGADGKEPRPGQNDLYTITVLDVNLGEWRSIPVDRVVEYISAV